MKKIIIANWKMNPDSPRSALRLANEVGRGVKDVKGVGVVLTPPFIFLSPVSSSMSRVAGLKLGAQDVFWEKAGAYTGEVSSLQLRALGVRFVVVGHSERRALGETDEMVAKKVKAVLESGMRPVLCIGEKEKEKDIAFPNIIRDELHHGLKNVKKTTLKNLIIAYEPVWAISTNKRAVADNPQNVYEMTILIRRELYRMFGKRIASQMPILYGGSVNEKNAASFVKGGGVDGLLVGGASLSSSKFVKIVEQVADL